jgi:hypothetical protein
VEARGALATLIPVEDIGMHITGRKVLVSEAVVSAELDDEAVLLNVQTGTYFGLDAVGTRIWKLLEQGATQEQICEHMLDEYEVEPDRLRSDVSQFLELMADKGLTRSGED